MLEGVWNQPQLLVEKDAPLAKLMGSGGNADKVSEHTYRVTFQNALPGVRSAVYLDGNANFPSPGSPAWQEGFMQPVSWAVSVGWTQLAALTTASDTLAVANVVDKTMTDAVSQVKITQDESLCNGDGTGYWATINSVTLGAGGSYTLSSTDFGARTFGVGNNIDIYNGTTYINTSNVTAVQERCSQRRDPLRRSRFRLSAVRLWPAVLEQQQSYRADHRHRQDPSGKQLHPEPGCSGWKHVFDASAVPPRPRSDHPGDRRSSRD
jgi:hypothetical protein